MDLTETTCRDQHLEIPAMSNNTTGKLEQKKKNEPRWAKHQTKKLRPQPTKINSFMSGPIKEGSKVINRDWVNH